MNDEDAKYLAFIAEMDQLRETFRSMVAGLVEDGFTDREARAMVAGMLALQIPQKPEEGR